MEEGRNLPPAISPIISRICDYMDEDPEIVDYYLKRFQKSWGTDSLRKVFSFVHHCEENNKTAMIKGTLEYDFSMENIPGNQPLTSRY